MTPRAAAEIASDLLDWLLADPGRLHGFMSATGLGPDDLRQRLADPSLAQAALDHLMSDEALLIAACAALELPPETPARAQAALGGGPGPHWT